MTGEYRPKPDSSAAALIGPIVRKFLLFMLFNIVNSSNYKGILRIGIGECLVQSPESRVQRIASERYGPCIGRVNALLAISKQTLILTLNTDKGAVGSVRNWLEANGVKP